MAAEQAVAAGERVEVTGDRTEYFDDVRRAGWMSFTLDQSVVPVRVHRVDGSWVAPARGVFGRQYRPEGRSGGCGVLWRRRWFRLVKVARVSTSMSLGWPGSLPKPVPDGPTATYQDVLDGVELRMTASVEGFSELLVVKTPETADNPHVRRIEFSLRADGLTVKPSGSGMTAVDADGRAAFSAPAALMWDSQGDATASGSPAIAARSSDSMISRDRRDRKDVGKSLP